MLDVFSPSWHAHGKLHRQAGVRRCQCVWQQGSDRHIKMDGAIVSADAASSHCCVIMCSSAVLMRVKIAFCPTFVSHLECVGAC